MTRAQSYEDLWRQASPQVLGALVRRYGHFDLAEDAVQEALLAASVQWPRDGLPDNPRSWLITVASRRLTDQLRSEEARLRREDTASMLAGTDPAGLERPADESGEEPDDTLTVLLLCCHPELSQASQIALTLRAVGGLSTAQIARAFLVPEATMAQRISRAKARIKSTGARFELPTDVQLPQRISAVLHVLYLVFNEGYAATSGTELQRADLTAEAIRLTRTVRDLLPADGEVVGLLALMLLTDARRAARTGPDGSLIPLAEQDRARWTRAAIVEGVALITGSLSAAPLGTYQLQAAIAALHDEAATAADTDWPQILALYGLLAQLQANPMVTLNQAVALAMVHGPRAGLDAIAELDSDVRMADHHRLHAVRAHLHELAGDLGAARAAYAEAARLTTSIPEQRYLTERASRIAAD